MTSREPESHNINDINEGELLTGSGKLVTGFIAGNGIGGPVNDPDATPIDLIVTLFYTDDADKPIELLMPADAAEMIATGILETVQELRNNQQARAAGEAGRG